MATRQHRLWCATLLGLALNVAGAEGSSANNNPAATSTLWVRGDTIELEGDITMELAAEFLRLARLHQPRRLVITSGGGVVSGALDMADYVHAHGMDVEVPTACFSSCANYIFPAACHKFIRGSGVVGWHGTVTHLLHLHDMGLQAIPDVAMPHVESMSERERAFYRKLGVDDFMPWFAKLPPYNVYDTYLLSVEDMARFGIHHVLAPEGYASTTDLSAWRTPDGPRVQFVSVDWPTLQTSRPPRAGGPNPEPPTATPACD